MVVDDNPDALIDQFLGGQKCKLCNRLLTMAWSESMHKRGFPSLGES
jgi:hypothetical protein